MINIEDLKKEIESLGYVATEELLYDTFNALCVFGDGKINPGQDIYAICLEGPPGAGKTEFAKVYTKLANKIFQGNVEMVDYQCDATTGKTELFEDINISAAIRRDADHVNIPGKLIDAITRVNAGKKVVLFIDEYDKAREETDAFLLQFLQSGKINSTQHGDLEIKEEYKSNLQVILCKNDMREELSGPLSRRIRIIRLDYMEPGVFYQVAHRTLIEERTDKVNDGLLNLVSLMYEHAYASREVYDRLPSCSEMLIALEDADRLLKRANAPQHIIYHTIIKNMFKSPDDIKTFESGLDRVKSENDSKLSALVKVMKSNEPNSETISINTLIAEKVFTDEGRKLTAKTAEMAELIETYKTKFAEMEQKRQETIDEEIQKILLENGKLVTASKPSTTKLFEDETSRIKRGFDIFHSTENDWTEVGSVTFNNLSFHTLISKLIANADALDITIYENGILLKEVGNLKLIVYVETDEDNNIRYRFMSSTPILPSSFLKDINNFVNFAKSLITVEQENNGTYDIDTLIYSNSPLELNRADENVYNLVLNSSVDKEELINIANASTSPDLKIIEELSKKMMKAKRKVLKNE